MKRGTLNFGGSSVQVWLDIQDGEIRASSVRPKESVRFADFAGKYETECLRAMKPASQASLKSNLKILCGHFGAMRLCDIGTENIQKWITGNPRSPKTISNQIATMRMVWNRARAWKYVKENPFEFLSLPKLNSSPASFTIVQARDIIRASEEPYKTIFWIAAETGMRSGEICGLFREDVDLDARIIRIRHSVFRSILQTPKTENAIRNISISRALAGHLSQVCGIYPSAVLDNRRDLPAISGAGLQALAPALLFSTENGRPYYNTKLVRALHPVLQKLGIDGQDIGLHAFRHCSASAMASLGVPEHIRRERLGHSVGNVTARYTHSTPEDHQKWAEIIGREFSPENLFSRAMAGD